MAHLVFNIFCGLFACLGSFLFGYDSGVIGSVLGMAKFKNDFPTSQLANLNGAIVSVFAGGCFFGAMVAGWSGDKVGRKRTIQLGCLIGAFGCALQTGLRNVGMLIAGRAIAGLSIGVLSMICPLYVSEISPPKIRGFITGLSQQMIGIGFIVSTWTAYGCQFINGQAAYRVPLGVQIIPCVILFIGCFWLPYSPRWLIQQGRNDEALRIVQYLHGDEAATLEFDDMVRTINYDMEHSSKSISVLWSTGPMMRRTLVAMGVQAFGQFTGVNVINYFGPKIYSTLGIQANKLLLIQGLEAVVGPITNFFYIIFAIDRKAIGRVRSLMFGSAGVAVCLSIEAALNAQYPPDSEHPNHTAQRAAISMFFISSIIFSLSYGPVSWVYASEVFPTHARSKGVAVATCANWACNVLLAQVSPIALDNITWRFYLVFVVVNIVTFFLVWMFFPETAGLSLEEIDEVFGDQKVAHNHLSDPKAMDRAYSNNGVHNEKFDEEHKIEHVTQ